MAQYPAVIELSSLDGNTGFQISGEDTRDSSGISVASAGDLNGDGFEDIIVGADLADPNGANSGATYVIFGKASGFAANLPLSTLNGTNGFQINGESAGGRAGQAVSSAGDFNGDGFDDLIIGASAAEPNADRGNAYIVFGKASGFGANLELSSLTGANGFQINAAEFSDGAGYSVSGAGDVNGDGFDDVIIAAPAGGVAYDGASYVLFGRASGFGSQFFLSEINGSNGFRIVNDNDFDVSSAGDINGDGFDDLLIGSPLSGSLNAGGAYVVFGKASGFPTHLLVTALNGSNGFRIAGQAGDYAGFSVSSAGDVNGDGFADIIVSSVDAAPHGPISGVSYVVFGKAGGFGATLALSSLNGTNGFVILGEAERDFSGYSVSAAGDMNGDGYDDLIVGSPGADPNGAFSGAAYIVFGKASGFASTLELSSLDGTNGVQINGEVAEDRAGASVGGGGDINGDGISDVIIGAYNASPNGSYSGASYVVFGRAPDAAVNRTGTAGADTLSGGNFADTLTGLGGNDTLYGHGGNDTINGGYGIDTAVFSGSRAAYTVFANGTMTIVGPEGTDTLFGVERAQFADQAVILGQGPKIYDFNADLKADLLWQNDNGYAAVWRINGTSQISGTVIGPNPGPAWHTRGAGDFDGDGDADVLWQNDNGTPLVWLMNNTDVVGGGAVGSNPGPAWAVIGSGDFNGDGKADILWQRNDGTPMVWLMNGTTVLGSGVLSNVGASWHVIGAGDFNGDAKSDILWQNDTGQAAVWLMNGTSVTSGGGVGPNPGTTWDVKAAGDFDGDGKSDILWQNDNGAPLIWFMDGTTVVSGGAVGSNPGAAWKVKGAGDFNADGKADISWQHTDGTPMIWLINGASVLSTGVLGNPGASWHVIAQGS